MKIVVVGAGAMGCLYGAKLSQSSSNEVYLLDVWQEHVDAINTHGLTVEEQGNDVVYKNVRAVSDAKDAGVCDLAIIFVKSAFTSAAVKNNKEIFGSDTVALTLQNGLGNVDLICDVVGSDNVIAGTTACGATMLKPGKIRFAGRGKTIIGEIDGKESARTLAIADVFQEAEFETEISLNVMGLIWDKLLINVGINALTGITQLHNGQLLDFPEIDEILEEAVKEAIVVAKAKGIELKTENPVENTKQICRNTAKNKSSMLQDVLNGKLTEIQMINGAIVREGKALGIATPVNMVLTNLITFIQNNSQQKL